MINSAKYQTKMANTYTQIYVQLVFAVAYRRCRIKEPIREEVQRYITGVVDGMNSKLLAVYCNPDHCHLLVGLHPSVSISDFARNVKAKTSKWINENQLTPSRFSWQDGYGAFTYTKESLPNLISYIRNQPEHHRVKSFREEYMDFLRDRQIPFDERYVFADPH
jgi:REP element-mobilizing transposase RayT